MPTWLIKTEPSTFSFADLERVRKTVWDGVTNNTALIHIRGIRKGDRLFIYHTGSEKQIVGLARALTDAYPDPKLGNPKLAVFELAPVRALKQPVPLSAIRSDSRFKEFALLKITRLSAMPVLPAVEKAILEMAGE